MTRKLLAIFAVALTMAPLAAQDECSSAITVVDGVNGVYTNVGMTTSAGTPAPSCLTSYKNDIWFAYTALVTGSHKITTDTPGLYTQGTHTDTILDVFDGSVCPPTTSLACDDDSGITPALSSTLTVNLTIGLTYYIRVSSFNTASDGSFWLTINPTPPANDECAGALPLSLGINPAPAASGYAYTLTDSTLSAGWAAPTCDTTANNADVWFSFIPTMSGLHQFDQETPGGFGAGTMTASVFDVFADTGCVPSAAIACDDDGGTIVGSGGLVIVNLTAGLTYYLRVTDDDTYSGGSFYVNVSFLGAAVVNDECAGAITILAGTNPAPAASGNTYTMDNSTLSPGWAAPTCDTTANSADVWFFFNCPTTGLWQFDQETPAGFTAGTLTATVFDVFADTGCVPSAAIACDDDSGTVVASGGLVVVNLTAGSNYYLRVTDDDGFNGGSFYVNATFLGVPAPNDECSTAIALGLGTNPAPAASGNFYSTANSSLSSGWAVPTCDTVVLSDVWFSFTPLMTGIYQFDQETPAGYTAGGLIGSVFDVFAGPSCTPSAAIACDDDGGVIVAGGGLATAGLTGGQTYYLRVSVDDVGAQGTTFYVNVTFLGAPAPNDECSTATVIGVGTTFANNGGATTSAGWPALSTCPTASAAINLDVWFSFTPTMSDVYQFDTATPCGLAAGSMTNPTIALYDGSVGTCGTPFAHTACDGDSSISSQAWLKASLVAGTTYYLRLGPTTSTGTAAVNASFYLTVKQGDIVNDTCATAIPLAMGTNPTPSASCNVYTNVGATDTTGTVCATIAKDLWFTFTPGASGNYDIDTNTPCGFTAATANTTLALYTGACPGSLLLCDADGGVGTLSALLNVALTGGTTYLLRVGVSSTTGEGTFYVNVNPTVGGGLTNDECSGAITVGLGANPAPSADCSTYSNLGATTSAGWATPCATVVNDVWFAFIPPHDGTYRIDLETPSGFNNGSMTNSTVAVYGSCTPGTPIACDADSGTTNGGLNSVVEAQLAGGVPAYIRVGSTSTTTEGSFYLNISEVFTLYFTSAPCGGGLVDVTANILAGPANGGYFMCVTLNQGAFPNGWLYGVDPFFDEVLTQVQTPGFVGALSPTGTATIGPVCGLPPGVFTFYGVALGFATPVIDIPIAVTDPVVLMP